MSETIPNAVLSEALRERLNRRTVLAAVFCTFRFDPGFFEQEVLPLLFDLQLHQVASVRKLQLEDALRPLAGRVAVYYDPGGLEEGGRGPASLDVRRIPVRPRTGYFHSKNLFLLVEDPDTAVRSLLVMTASANLTQAGWWENVECAHVEEIADGGRSRLREGLLDFLDRLRASSRTIAEHGPLDTIRQFVRQLQPVPHRSAQGRLHMHFMANGRRGGWSFAELLRDLLPDDIAGANLEIISPYLDDADSSEPLAALLDLVRPRRWRILLPEDGGAARCRESLFDWVRQEGGQWGRLPGTLTSAGDRSAAPRRVHAKMYRLFTTDREVVVLGSFNLTRPAHQAAGNVETAVLVEGPAGTRRRFWLQPVEERPLFADVAAEDDGVDTAVIPLVVRYHWDSGQAEAMWDGRNPSPKIDVYANGVQIFTVADLPAGARTELPVAASEALRDRLRSTSFLTLRTGERWGIILVMEEGMAYRPSLLLDLSPADILRYWSLLTPAQRAAVLAAHGERLADFEGVERLSSPLTEDVTADSIFDRHAGMFHAFGSLARTVLGALADGGAELARFRMFGAKYDSLPVLVERLADDAAGDPLDRYLMLLCAQQLADRVRRDRPEFWAGEPGGVARLETALAVRARLRAEITARNDEQMASFLDWYEVRFLREAEAVPA
ncbi:hypothetical protein [Phytohabitans rumicis]|uniref:PLD phosphodiesterase domain-containing protein n=1 Tax=Phytohabitans rumicis TaxID=1076125 RepID=A0A6V8L747_9ACTN|nr:hypothetical protein [Phytohabitans rumicis]GFJ89936.1 hypothetical protein Prum_035780 [Phytohabitans rumicis]